MPATFANLSYIYSLILSFIDAVISTMSPSFDASCPIFRRTFIGYNPCFPLHIHKSRLLWPKLLMGSVEAEAHAQVPFQEQI